MKRWVLEDYYGYPAVGSAEWFQTLRRIFLWLDKVLREFKGDHPLPWRKAGKVLVVGYGAGGNLKTLHDQGWGVSGNEVREEAAAHARALTGGTIHTGTLGFHIFAPNTFDLSLMRRLAEHFPSLTDALRLVHALLKDEGLLAVSVPNVNSIEAKLFGWSWFYWDPSRHFYHFGKDSLTPFLIQAGFRPYRFRTGVDSLFFMASLDRCWKQRFHAVLPWRMLIDRLLVRPFCLLASHVGFGTEITGHVGKPAPQGNHGGA